MVCNGTSMCLNCDLYLAACLHHYCHAIYHSTSSPCMSSSTAPRRHCHVTLMSSSTALRHHCHVTLMLFSTAPRHHCHVTMMSSSTALRHHCHVILMSFSTAPRHHYHVTLMSFSTAPCQHCHVTLHVTLIYSTLSALPRWTSASSVTPMLTPTSSRTDS